MDWLHVIWKLCTKAFMVSNTCKLRWTGSWKVLLMQSWDTKPALKKLLLEQSIESGQLCSIGRKTELWKFQELLFSWQINWMFEPNVVNVWYAYHPLFNAKRTWHLKMTFLQSLAEGNEHVVKRLLCCSYAEFVESCCRPLRSPKRKSERAQSWVNFNKTHCKRC